jgi:hypothetical protein
LRLVAAVGSAVELERLALAVVVLAVLAVD